MQASEHLLRLFFEALNSENPAALEEVTVPDVCWRFPGEHPLGGVHRGTEGVRAFFRDMGSVMARCGATVRVLASGEGTDCLTECQEIQARCGSTELKQRMCVIWTFENGRLKEGCHLAEDVPQAEVFFRQAFRPELSGFEGLAAPAARALARAGIHRPEDLTGFRRDVLANMHGIGPKALTALEAQLRARGMTFRK